MDLDDDLEALERKFADWELNLANKVNITVDQAFKVFEDCKIPITRLVIPKQVCPNRFFRARIVSSESNEDLSDPKTYSYPPVSFVTSFQRK